MKIVVVGADHLGMIADKLSGLGINEIEHISGRSAMAQRHLRLPAAAVLILVLVDCLNHNTMHVVKAGAKSRSIPVIFASRSWASISGKLARAGLAQPR